MNTVVIGATSASGKVLVKKLLTAGYSVTAIVRSPEKMEQKSSLLQVVQADVRQKDSFASAIKKDDVVFSFLGPKGDVKKIAAEGTQNIIDVMKTQGAQRLIVISVAGIAVANDNREKTFIDKLLRFFLRDMYDDREAQLEALRNSGIQCTALRVPRLTDGTGGDAAKAFFGKPSPSMKLSRSSLADFMITEAQKNKWVGKAPIVAEK